MAAGTPRWPSAVGLGLILESRWPGRPSDEGRLRHSAVLEQPRRALQQTPVVKVVNHDRETERRRSGRKDLGPASSPLKMLAVPGGGRARASGEGSLTGQNR